VLLVLNELSNWRFDNCKTHLDLSHNEVLCARYLLNNPVLVLNLGCCELHERLSAERMCLVDLAVHQKLFSALVQLGGDLEVHCLASWARGFYQRVY